MKAVQLIQRIEGSSTDRMKAVLLDSRKHGRRNRTVQQGAGSSRQRRLKGAVQLESMNQGAAQAIRAMKLCSMKQGAEKTTNIFAVGEQGAVVVIRRQELWCAFQD